MSELNKFKVIIIYNYYDAYFAMKAASKLKKNIYISSPPNAASYIGPLFFKKLLKKVKQLFPNVNYHEILDCGNDRGLALEAIHYGIKNIEIKCNENALKKIKNICKKQGVGINNTSRKKLDLKNIEDVYSECIKWLSN